MAVLPGPAGRPVCMGWGGGLCVWGGGWGAHCYPPFPRDKGI